MAKFHQEAIVKLTRDDKAFSRLLIKSEQKLESWVLEGRPFGFITIVGYVGYRLHFFHIHDSVFSNFTVWIGRNYERKRA